MDIRITLQRPAPVPDAQGSVIDSWAGLASVWAKAEAVPSVVTQEAAKDRERHGSQDYRFTIRHQSALESLTVTDRIVWQGKHYDILAAVPMPEGRPDTIIITARRRA
ncbi:MAG: phage head closure protein [Verrucomicrobiota bacterium]